MPNHDAQRHSAPAERNRQPILEVLLRWLPVRGAALEIASGTGQHAVHFAAGLPGWAWQPTDPEPKSLASIAAWRDAAALANLLPPVALDVLAWPWPVAAPVDAIFCANMLHISPWATCAGLLRGAARHLAGDGQLILYGPYLIDGVETAQGNLDFDTDLRARNPAWGLRRLADVEAAAAQAGLALRERAAMPANNTMLRFVRASAP
jgi:hypothetical protein